MTDRYPIPDFLHRQPEQPDGPRERPVLFSAPMIRALLAGTKTQTRRVVKPQLPYQPTLAKHLARRDYQIWHCEQWQKFCPYGKPGDRLWVREAFMHEPADYCWEASVSIPCRPAHTVYRADFPECDQPQRGVKWSPSIRMPRALSRIDLEITAVRVERLQDISEADALAEGVTEGAGDFAGCFSVPGTQAMSGTTAKECYARLWDDINGAGSWAANPFCWVIEFRRITP